MKKLFLIWALILPVVFNLNVNLVSAQNANAYSFKKEGSNSILQSDAASIPTAWTISKSTGKGRPAQPVVYEGRPATRLTIAFDALRADPGKLKFRLPSGRELIAASSHTNLHNVWEGKIQITDNPALVTQTDSAGNGEVILSFHDGFVSGVIYAGDETFEILPVGDAHYLVEYNPAASDKNFDCDVAADESGTADYWSRSDKTENEVNTGMAASSAPLDSGDRVDVMVLYSDAVMRSFGGGSQTEAFIQTAVATGNTVFRNSFSRTRLNLVQTINVAYPESGNLNTDLTWIKGNPGINQARNAASADLVVMLVEAGDACGTSQLLTKTGIVFGSGFSMVKRSCAVGGTAFAHEIGHSFGAAHDPLDSPVPVSMHVLPFAYGNAVNGQFVTLMGLFSNSACPQYCPRVLAFSSPAVFVNGIPTGIAGVRDNAAVIDYTADSIANIRTSGRTITLLSTNSPVMWRRNLRRNISWESSGITGDVRIELSRDGGRTFETLVERTPNDGTESITVKGRSKGSSRIRISSCDFPLVTDTSLVNFSIL